MRESREKDRVSREKERERESERDNIERYIHN